MYDTLKEIIEAAEHIIILQADNPDADSLGSALALEQLLGNLGKTVSLYGGVDTPTYLRYLSGWDRVSSELPQKFDASIIVDASTLSLFEKLSTSGQQGWIASKPCIVLDHHETTDDSIYFANTVINQPELSSTGELIFQIADSLGWTIDSIAATNIMSAILGDTQGLTNELTTANTYRIMATLTDFGANRTQLEELRREFSKMDARIFKYKAALIDRTELHHENQIAIVTIPQSEINEFSPLYNPAPLIQGDMLQTLGVKIAIVLKHYDNGKVLASIRANAPIAAELAASFGGGGHSYASGFKIDSTNDFLGVKTNCIQKTIDLLNEFAAKESA